MWDFCKFKKLNPYADNGIAYSRGVNRGDPKSRKKANGEAKRLNNLKKAKQTLCL